MSDAPPPNPADLPLVTLDHNALIALREDEADAPAVHALMELKRAGHVRVCVTMNMAMEARSTRGRLDWPALAAWQKVLGLETAGPRSVAFTDPTAPDTMLFSPELEIQLTERIHHILFPNMPYMWNAYLNRETGTLTATQKRALLESEALRNGATWIPARPTPGLDALTPAERLHIEQLGARLHRKWFNAKNDAGGFHIHLTEAWHTHHPEWAVFVTSDHNFFKVAKREALRALGYRGEILRPGDAVTFLRSVLDPPSPA